MAPPTTIDGVDRLQRLIRGRAASKMNLPEQDETTLFESTGPPVVRLPPRRASSVHDEHDISIHLPVHCILPASIEEAGMKRSRDGHSKAAILCLPAEILSLIMTHVFFLQCRSYELKWVPDTHHGRLTHWKYAPGFERGDRYKNYGTEGGVQFLAWYLDHHGHKLPAAWDYERPWRGRNCSKSINRFIRTYASGPIKGALITKTSVARRKDFTKAIHHRTTTTTTMATTTATTGPSRINNLRRHFPPTILAMLLVCRRFHDIGMGVFYNRADFSFGSMSLLRTFMDNVTAALPAWLNKIHLCHEVTGHPRFTTHKTLQEKDHRNWITICHRAATTMTRLREVTLLIRLKEYCPDLSLAAPWALGVLEFRRATLDVFDVALIDAGNTDATTPALRTCRHQLRRSVIPHKFLGQFDFSGVPGIGDVRAVANQEGFVARHGQGRHVEELDRALYARFGDYMPQSTS